MSRQSGKGLGSACRQNVFILVNLYVVNYVNWDNKKKRIDSFATDNDSRSLKTAVAYLGRSHGTLDETGNRAVQCRLLTI